MSTMYRTCYSTWGDGTHIHTHTHTHIHIHTHTGMHTHTRTHWASYTAQYAKQQHGILVCYSYVPASYVPVYPLHASSSGMQEAKAALRWGQVQIPSAGCLMLCALALRWLALTVAMAAGGSRVLARGLDERQ